VNRLQDAPRGGRGDDVIADSLDFHSGRVKQARSPQTFSLIPYAMTLPVTYKQPFGAAKGLLAHVRSAHTFQSTPINHFPINFHKSGLTTAATRATSRCHEYNLWCPVRSRLSLKEKRDLGSESDDAAIGCPHANKAAWYHFGYSCTYY